MNLPFKRKMDFGDDQRSFQRVRQSADDEHEDPLFECIECIECIDRIGLDVVNLFDSLNESNEGGELSSPGDQNHLSNSSPDSFSQPPPLDNQNLNTTNVSARLEFSTSSTVDTSNVARLDIAPDLQFDYNNAINSTTSTSLDQHNNSRRERQTFANGYSHRSPELSRVPIQETVQGNSVRLEKHSFSTPVYHSYTTYGCTFAVLKSSTLPRSISACIDSKTWQGRSAREYRAVSIQENPTWIRQSNYSHFELTMESQERPGPSICKVVGSSKSRTNIEIIGDFIVIQFVWKPVNGFKLFRPEQHHQNKVRVSISCAFDDDNLVCVPIEAPVHVFSKRDGRTRMNDLPPKHTKAHDSMKAYIASLRPTRC
mmetsp:Transcript_8859/g.15581  ORF Transcript_8859/g.15581 Transcript_8859/m.15581 type:complete len:370 (+) Transcript_8859:145-1254(+)